MICSKINLRESHINCFPSVKPCSPLFKINMFLVYFKLKDNILVVLDCLVYIHIYILLS